MMNECYSKGEVREIRFENPQLESIGIEILDLDTLRGKMSLATLMKPERVDFLMLIYVTSGEGVHWVDFEESTLKTGTLVSVRPGQVQRWQTECHCSAVVALIDPTVLPYWGELPSSWEGDLLALLDWQTTTQLPPSLALEIATMLSHLGKDIKAFDGSDLDLSLIRHEFLVLMLRIARWQRSLVAEKGFQRRQLATYRLFLSELEKAFKKEHSLTFYANRLGYSKSTISRACIAAEGRAAKSVIDRRIALEAKRTLFHTNLSIAEIGHALGYSETTNFVKFFRRNVGTTPHEFRLHR